MTKSTSPKRSALTLAALVSIAAVLAAGVLRPTKATLWPLRAEQWLSGKYGSVGLDEPPHR